jgi:digeranylgeranylglycerophospholipid reductase
MSQAIYDVVIIGAGPAGGQCARELTQQGKKVLVAERFQSFKQNDFSSAGSPLETIEDFNLPKKVIGAYWDTLIFATEEKEYVWKSSKKRGLVFDFAGLRQFLREESEKKGGKVKMGCTFISRGDMKNGLIKVKLKEKNKEFEVFAKVLVDATGPARAVIYKKGEKQPVLSSTPGVEYLIRIKTKNTRKRIDPHALYFFSGNKWAPAGYSWIFPMQSPTFKFGVGVSAKKYHSITSAPMTDFVDKLIHEYVGNKGFEVIDKHGGIVRGAPQRDDIYFKDNILAIGDAVSTIYPFAGEGVRHALHSGRFAARHILRYLEGNTAAFSGYQKDMEKYFGWKWWAGQKAVDLFTQQTKKNASSVDGFLSLLQYLSLDEVVNIGFFYNFLVLLNIPLRRFLFQKAPHGNKIQEI